MWIRCRSSVERGEKQLKDPPILAVFRVFRACRLTRWVWVPKWGVEGQKLEFWGPEVHSCRRGKKKFLFSGNFFFFLFFRFSRFSIRIRVGGQKKCPDGVFRCFSVFYGVWDPIGWKFSIFDFFCHGGLVLGWVWKCERWARKLWKTRFFQLNLKKYPPNLLILRFSESAYFFTYVSKFSGVKNR